MKQVSKMQNNPKDPKSNSFDINKPVSSRLDISENSFLDQLDDDGLFDEPVAPVQPIITAYSDDGEIYPEPVYPKSEKRYPKPKNPQAAPMPQAPKKVSLAKPKKAPQMPAVRADNTNNNQPSAHDQKPKKVSLAKPKKAPQMPGIRSDGSEPVIPWRNENNEVQTPLKPERQRLGSGTVNFAFSPQKTAVLIAVAALAAAILTALLNSLIPFRGMQTVIAAVFGINCFIQGVNLTRLGEKWDFKATGREIIFSRKGQPSYIIFYKDVLSVDYEPYKFLGMFETGYTVTVIVNGERHEFKYVFPRLNTKVPFEFTPFEIIRAKIDAFANDNA